MVSQTRNNPECAGHFQNIFLKYLYTEALNRFSTNASTCV